MLEHIEALKKALVQHHDIEDRGAPGEHPTQGPNWAMRATNWLDEAESEIRKGLAKRAAKATSEQNNGIGEK